jgi:hypothetical protein
MSSGLLKQTPLSTTVLVDFRANNPCLPEFHPCRTSSDTLRENRQRIMDLSTGLFAESPACWVGETIDPGRPELGTFLTNVSITDNLDLSIESPWRRILALTPEFDMARWG